MAVLKPISCIRPATGLAARVATGPHSALSKEEIRAKVADNPVTFSRIVHPKALFGDVPDVYARAAEMLKKWVSEGILLDDRTPAFYLYYLESDGHAQSGLVGLTPVDEILCGHIHAHETIRESKLMDLASHIEECGAQIGGPILMACRAREELTGWIRRRETTAPLYDFISENGVKNRIWKIDEPEEMAWLTREMELSGDLYIADGHHRVMAALEICRRQREAHPDYTGEEPWNYLACVCFPDRELQILPYSRVVAGLNGLTAEEFLGSLQKCFEVSRRNEPFLPSRKGEFGLLLRGEWYRLRFREELRPSQPQDALDVSVLQSFVLEPVLGIRNPRSDSRLEFVGGKNQLESVTARCARGEAAGFLFWPTSMEELFAVADADATMPPKSTWFEPKLCNGLFIYRLSSE